MGGREGVSFLTTRTGMVLETLVDSLDVTAILKKFVAFSRPESFRLCTPIPFAEITGSANRSLLLDSKVHNAGL